MVTRNSNDSYGVAARPDGPTLWVALSLMTLLSACASLPPGSRYPKAHSEALADSASTRFAQKFAAEARNHAGRSGFRIINVGVDGFLMRLEMINAAERTLDLQYYIFREDETGHLLSDALVKAADRGVRIRILVDDGETKAGDEQLLALSGHAAIETRVFNPFAYRGYNWVIRGAEYLLRHSRLDYRMHNKLIVADNAIALTGGRNVGDQYFQIDPASQFADDDVFVAGPVTQKLSAEFDEYWNSALAIPAEALRHRGPQNYLSSPNGDYSAARAQKVNNAGFDYRDKLAHGEPLASLLAGQQPLIWADAQVVYDSPDKKPVVKGVRVGSLMYEPLANDVMDVQSELLLATPYLIPTQEEMRLIKERREHGVRVRILTNSLEATPDVVAHAGYMHYRGPFLKDGVELYEVRSFLGSTRGSGESVKVSRYGNYALHGKIFVMDREKLYIGSMNLDQRSRRLNTEMGLIINNADLSQQMATRFEAMVQLKSAYTVSLRSENGRDRSGLVWQTDESGTPVEYHSEPARSHWQRFEVKFLTLLPLDPEL